MLIKKVEKENQTVYFLFNNIPLLRVEKTSSGRTFYRFCGIKFAIREKSYSGSKLIELNKEYELNSGKIPLVADKFKTLGELLNSNKSISRFGDGEFNLIFGENLPFQEYNKELSGRLKEILNSDSSNILIAIPDVFASLEQYTNEAQKFWRKYIVSNRQNIYGTLNFNKQYYDTEVSRPYMDVLDKTKVEDYFKEFKKLWQDKDVVFVEGEATRLGVGNDLFKGAKSIKRIIAPAKSAYSKYNDILSECLKLNKDNLFIIALGPTATVLAYDLSAKGYRALDLGHIDIEYEWFLRKTLKKIPIKNKYVNECRGGKKIENLKSEAYLNQIIKDLSRS